VSLQIVIIIVMKMVC